VAAQRKTIGMLFFWEEEAIRWLLLEQERAEIAAAMEGAEDEAVKRELAVRMESVKMRMAMRPSQRGTVVDGPGDVSRSAAEAPPEYASG
jgi:hypothetical protein